MMDCPWLSNLLVTLWICASRFSEMFFSISDWLDSPSMAFTDWRVMF